MSKTEIDTTSSTVENNTSNSHQEDEEVITDKTSPTHLQTMIEEVRAKFIQEYETNPDMYDPTDCELICKDDWQVERFIRRKKTTDESFQMLISTLRWRHQMHMPRTKDTDFPEEFFKIGTMFGFEPDLDNNAVIYFRVRLHRKVKELEKFIKLFILHIINKVDMSVQGKGLTVVFDCGGAGLTNLDMDIVWFLVDSLLKYYPYGLKHILVLEMPWILSSAWSIVKGWMPLEFRDKIKFVNNKTITEYIAKENLPYYIGGVCTVDYHHVPKGCRPAEELASKQGLTKKEMKKILKYYQPLIVEANEESRLINEQ